MCGQDLGASGNRAVTPPCAEPSSSKSRESQDRERAVSFADQVAAFTQEFPRGYDFLVDQLNRAALSIATNLAEGNGRFTKPDRKNFFTIARGSAQECVPLLEIARRRGLLNESQHEALRQDLETIAKMVSGLIKGMEKREA